MTIKIGFLSLMILLAVFQNSQAAVPNKSQTQCLLALQSAGAKVASTASLDAVKCIRSAIKGKLNGTEIEACIATESQALMRAKAKTTASLAQKCNDLPKFGPVNAQEINTAYAGVLDLQKLLGDDIASTLKTTVVDAEAASCQLALAEEMATIARAEMLEYNRCSRQLLIKNRASSSADLEACVGKESATIKKAKNQASNRLAKKCATVASSVNFPGACEGVATEELGNCLAAQAHCSSCEAVNAAEHLQASGHQFKAGVATYYCGTRPKQTHSVARLWNEQILDAIRLDNPRPPVHARNLFHLSAAMYDAWAAYDATAAQYLTEEYPIWNNPKRDRDIAISFAAYRVLSERYSEKYALGFTTSQARFDEQMNALGLDKNYKQTNGDNPSAVGNRIAAAILKHGKTDGSNEAQNFADASYAPVNKPLIVKDNGIDLVDAEDPAYQLDPNHWQPLALDKIVSQNGIPLPGKYKPALVRNGVLSPRLQ